MAPPRPWNIRSGLCPSHPSSETRSPKVEDEIHEFWGQLWLIPHSKTQLQPPRVRSEDRFGLVWVRKDLWERKEFGVDDCFPIREGDVWDVQPKHLNFAENFWGEGKKRSFLWAAKQAMANRGRGRGPRPRNPEEEWVD